MKTLKITTDNKIRMIDINMSDCKAIQKELGGHFETVHTKIMYEYYKAPVIMLVDEEGLWKRLPLNVVGSYFYGTQEHGNPIAGEDTATETTVKKENLMCLDFRVWGTKEQLMALRDYMKENHLRFGKVE